MQMNAADVIRKVRQLEIKTRQRCGQFFIGEYHSAFKGQGLAFSDVREYQEGDDVRNIDWNVTARMRSPFVKVFEEDRALNILLLVDVSASSLFGTQKKMKSELIAELCAVLSFSAAQNHDKTGAVFFTDRVEKYIPAERGRSQSYRILSELIRFTPQQKGTQLTTALQFLNNVEEKRSVVFILSDFATENYERWFQVVARKHEVVALQVYDKHERELPDVGLMEVMDAESGNTISLDTGSAKVRTAMAERFEKYLLQLKTVCNKAGVDMLSISTGDDYIKLLLNFFERRAFHR
jgi:uncharacterized protein (DUF58 family)